MPDATAIGALVTLLSLIGGGVTWVVRRRDTKKDPIPKESAAVALAQSGVSLMQGIADRLQAEIGELRIEVAESRAEVAESRADVGHLRTDVQRLTVTLGAAARYIERLLRWARSDSRPPIPPLPSELHDLIDPSLYD